MTDEEERELRISIMHADLSLKQKQAFWETPKGFAAVIAALAVTVGAIGGVVGYQIGRSPPQQIIFQPGSITVQPAPSGGK